MTSNRTVFRPIHRFARACGRRAWAFTLAAGVVGAAVIAASPGDATAQGQCDGKAKPCPLQQWMRDNVGTPMSAGDMATVARSMETARKFGGPGMKDWDKLAKQTADNAKANKVDAVKADCKQCHDLYKDAFKNDAALRNKPVR
jgi:hypothetical protein